MRVRIRDPSPNPHPHPNPNLNPNLNPAHFFDPDQRALLRSAAQREGVDPAAIDGLIVSMAHLRAGGASLHDGRTWHGSGPNASASAPRRGLGIHFVPACATFAPGAELGKLWAPLKQPGTDALPDDLLPVTWVPPSPRLSR